MQQQFDLPTPQIKRWQPLRCGLVNLFKYDDQTFHFTNGRLLLRGNNGTGKSRVLALQLPFLLDGEMDPTRVEPDQDRSKRMEWNLLMGRLDERLGYSWLEFGRINEEKENEYLTIGCGMQAVRNRGTVNSWFFTTNQRIGQNLWLMDKSRIPLAKKLLINKIGDRGTVFLTAKNYRNNINKHLFDLSSERYKSLIQLLIQLRQPQLSRQLDEKKLSQALSESLPPLDEKIIVDVADAMSSLEKEQQDLDSLKSAHEAVNDFLKDYRKYAKISARSVAEPVRKKHSAYEQAARDYKKAETAKNQAEQNLQKLKTKIENLMLNLSRAKSRVKTLGESPEMKSAQDLERLRQLAEGYRKEATSRKQELEKITQQIETQEKQLNAENQKIERQWKKLKNELDSASKNAKKSSCFEKHREQIDQLNLPIQAIESQINQIFNALNQIANKQKQSAEHLSKCNKKITHSQQVLQQAQTTYDNRARSHANTLDEHRSAGEAVELEIQNLVLGYQQWSESIQILQPDTSDQIETDLRDWTQNYTNECPTKINAMQALQNANASLAQEQAKIDEQKQRHQEKYDETLDTIKHLESGKHTPPPVPYTRHPEARHERPGAPLWRLIDFGNLAESEHTGIEAALESAGLLDAWVSPEGDIIDQNGDIFLSVNQDTNQSSTHKTLDGPLVPSSDLPQNITPNLIRRILQHIGLGANQGVHWVTSDGHWCLGPVRGHWSKETIQHIGHTAREAERQRQLTHYRQQLKQCESDLKTCDENSKIITQKKKGAASEASQLPSDAVLRQALSKCKVISDRVSQDRNSLAEAEEALAEKRNTLEKQVAERDQDARDLGLEKWSEDTSPLLDSIESYRRNLASLKPGLLHHADARQSYERAERLFKETTNNQTHAEGNLRNAENKAVMAEEEYDVANATVGADAKKIIADYRAAQKVEEQTNRELTESREEQNEANCVVGEARATKKSASDTQEKCKSERHEAIESLHQFIETGLLAIADEAISDSIDTNEDWSAKRGVDVARRIDRAFHNTDYGDQERQRSEKAILDALERLKEILGPKGYPPQNQPTISQHFVITVLYHNQRRSLIELLHTLTQNIDDHQELLDQKEKEVIENHLIDEVASHLHDLIQQGEALVCDMNGELSDRSMSTGMQLRFFWKINTEEDDQLAVIRQQLLKNPDVQTQDQRATMADFLQNRIRQARESDELLNWHDSLSQALDYRTWHQFGVERRAGPNESWQRLTRKTHGTGSGGEKAVALTIPQFAAASAYYHSAAPYAPRLIMLDEAFVGVDPDMRRKCMELLQAFDLDFMMTSENEWGCYPNLTGNSIYQLSTQIGANAVLCTHWIWNGHEKFMDDSENSIHAAQPPESASEHHSLLENALPEV